jgi:hypothetical protein
MSMPPTGLEPTIPAIERPKTHALDRAATAIGDIGIVLTKFLKLKYSGHCSYFRTPVWNIRSSSSYIKISRRRRRETDYLCSSAHSTSLLADVSIWCCCVALRTNLHLQFLIPSINYRVHNHQNTAGNIGTSDYLERYSSITLVGDIFARRRKEHCSVATEDWFFHIFIVLSV